MTERRRSTAGRTEPRLTDPRRTVRERFLAPGSPYGCAESVLLALEDAFGLEDRDDGAAAMALNGGIAYSGATCGAITGAALALGRLAASRIADRPRAKRVARELTAEVLDAYEARFGASDCRTLTGFDLRAPGGHDAFIAAGAWRTSCLRGLQFVVDRLAPLADEATWEAAIAALDASRADGPGSSDARDDHQETIPG